MLKILRSDKRKSLTAALLLAVLVIAAVGATVAYIHYAAGPVENEFGSAAVSAEIVEIIEDETKKSVKVKNNSTFDVYIRVAVVANRIDEEGNIIGGDDVTEWLNYGEGTDWVRIGNYYYYKTTVVKGGSTTNLLKDSGIHLNGRKITILSDAIQAAPADAVEEAWGVTYGANGPKAASN